MSTTARTLGTLNDYFDDPQAGDQFVSRGVAAFHKAIAETPGVTPDSAAKHALNFAPEGTTD
jgi:hypothetical protein